MKKCLHLVSFDIPYPPNYGGIIDVFFKIKELHKLGVAVYLHTYIFDNKVEQAELKKYCKEVFYYKRKNTLLSLFSRLPFRVESRSSKKLIATLKSNDIPIVFEGLHTVFPLKNNAFKKAYVRTHNIEHTYFLGLFKSEKNLFKKVFYYAESKKLKKFESVLKKAAGIFTISKFDQQHFSKLYGKKTMYIPVFHDAKQSKITSKKGSFILYHGDLRVADNVRAAMFLVDVYKESPYKLIIASSCKNKTVLKEINKHEDIFFKDIPTQKSLTILLQQAQVNALFTFQKTGIKLKLLNTLHQGKHVVANSKMIEDTGLENLCELANTKQELLQVTEALFKTAFSENQVKARKYELDKFNPTLNAQKMIDIIFK
tara:strand:- start:21 stop:1133 length:1113 start_codon:yes stop_codon:yes gene_type:complete